MRGNFVLIKNYVMKIPAKIENYFNKIQGINYNNENGGAYAYLQYMAYTRELSKQLRSFRKVERELELLDGINWLFNECLGNSFNHSHKVIFETKMSETKEIFESIRSVIKNERKINQNRIVDIYHAQAA